MTMKWNWADITMRLFHISMKWNRSDIISSWRYKSSYWKTKNCRCMYACMKKVVAFDLNRPDTWHFFLLFFLKFILFTQTITDNPDLWIGKIRFTCIQHFMEYLVFGNLHFKNEILTRCIYIVHMVCLHLSLWTSCNSSSKWHYQNSR